MSWHTGGVAIQGVVAGDPASVVASLGFAGSFSGQMVSGDVAGSSSLDGRAVGTVGGWTFVWDPMMLMDDDSAGAFDSGIFPIAVEARLRQLSMGGRVFAFLTEGASSTHGYSVYADGRRIRTWLTQEYESVLDEGEPLEEEGAFMDEEDGEQRVLGMLTAITRVTFNDIFETQFAVVE